MSVEKGNAVSVRVFNMSNNRQMDLLVNIEQIGDLDTPLLDVCLSPVISLSALFHMYVFGYSHGISSVISYTEVSADVVATPSTSGITSGP